MISSAIKYHSSEAILFIAVRKTVPIVLNDFLQEIDCRGMGFLKRIHLPKARMGNNCVGLSPRQIFSIFWREKLTKVLMMYRLFGEIVDVCSGNSNMATITDISTQFVQLVHSIR